MEYITSNTPVLEEIFNDEEKDEAKKAALRFLQSSFYSIVKRAKPEYTQWFQLSDVQNTILIKLIEFSGADNASEDVFEDACSVLGKIVDVKTRHDMLRSMLPLSIVRGDQKTSSVLKALGKFENPLSGTACHIIEAGIEALCHPDITEMLSKTEEYILLRVKHFLKKVTDIDGKLERVEAIFNLYQFLFITPILDALGKSEAVHPHSIKFADLYQTFTKLRKLCIRNTSTYSYFMQEGSKFKTFEDVFEAVGSANKGSDFQIDSGLKEEFSK